MDQPMKIFIVEDEYLNLLHLKNSLIEMGYEVTGEAGSAEETLELLKTTEVDLIILDINLGEGEKDGIWIGEYVSEHYDFPFIYLTAYGTDSIVKKAIKTAPYAYLTKPFNEVELSTSIQLAIHSYNSNREKSNSKKLLIGNKRNFAKIELDDIHFVESDKNYIKIYTGEKEYKERTTLQTILQELPEERFLQIHRSFVINTKKIQEISSTMITVGNIQIPVTKNSDKLMQLYKNG